MTFNFVDGQSFVTTQAKCESYKIVTNVANAIVRQRFRSYIGAKRRRAIDEIRDTLMSFIVVAGRIVRVVVVLVASHVRRLYDLQLVVVVVVNRVVC